MQSKGMPTEKRDAHSSPIVWASGFVLGWLLARTFHPMEAFYRLMGVPPADGEPADERLYVDEEVRSEAMLPYVCADCGANFDYTHSAPDECPKCSGTLIRTE